jgi:hypothetical protein
MQRPKQYKGAVVVDKGLGFRPCLGSGMQQLWLLHRNSWPVHRGGRIAATRSHSRSHSTGEYTDGHALFVRRAQAVATSVVAQHGHYSDM